MGIRTNLVNSNGLINLNEVESLMYGEFTSHTITTVTKIIRSVYDRDAVKVATSTKADFLRLHNTGPKTVEALMFLRHFLRYILDLKDELLPKYVKKTNVLNPHDILDEYEIWQGSIDHDATMDKIWKQVYEETGDDDPQRNPALYRMIMHVSGLLTFMSFVAAELTGWRVNMIEKSDYERAKKLWDKEQANE